MGSSLDALSLPDSPAVNRERRFNQCLSHFLFALTVASCGGTVASTEDAGVGDDGGAFNAGNITCGAQSCTDAEDCCLDSNNPPPACIARGGACAGLRLECSGTTNCPMGQVCCGMVGISGTASCASQCQTSEHQLCWDNGGTRCPVGTQCQQAFAVHYCCGPSGC